MYLKAIDEPNRHFLVSGYSRRDDRVKSERWAKQPRADEFLRGVLQRAGVENDNNAFDRFLHSRSRPVANHWSKKA